VNNLNDALTWGVFPLFFAAAGMGIHKIGILAAVCPATWGIAQLGTGLLSDRVGRKRLIVAGMWIQACGIGWVAVSSEFIGFFFGTALLGLGTAMVYPTLLAAVGDIVHPSWRASSVGVYRLWRDLGYVAGALLVGVIADGVGVIAAMWAVATLTFVSGVAAALRMTETLHSKDSLMKEGGKSAWPYPAQ
jgi:MFS family permease